MKINIFLFALLLSGCFAFAQEPSISLNLSEKPGYDGKRFGAGLMLGEPLGASVKYWIAENSAIDGGLGLSFNDGDNFHVHADYLHHIPDVIAIDEGQFLLYFGGGPRFKVRNNKDNLFGLRTLAGLTSACEPSPDLLMCSRITPWTLSSKPAPYLMSLPTSKCGSWPQLALDIGSEFPRHLRAFNSTPLANATWADRLRFGRVKP